MRLGLHAIALILLAFAGSASGYAQRITPEKVEDYEISYDVPESPASYLLDASPANVVRGSNAKPIMISLLQDIIAGKNLEPGLAIDFAPYPVFGGTVASIQELRTNRLLYALSNLTVSFGTATNKADSSSVSYAAGLRVTLWDDRDIIHDDALIRDIGTALAESASSPTGADAPTPDNDEISKTTVKKANLEEVYGRAREKMRTSKGFTLSLGFGYTGSLHSGAFTADSMFGERAKLWIAPQYSLGGGTDLLGTLHVSDSNLVHGGNLVVGGGFALRGNLHGASVAAEGAWASDTKWTFGVNAEVDVITGVRLIGALTTERSELDPTGPARLKLRGSLQYNTGR